MSGAKRWGRVVLDATHRLANGSVDDDNREYAVGLTKIFGGAENAGGGLTIAGDGGKSVFVFFVNTRVYVAAREPSTLIVTYTDAESVNLLIRRNLFAKRFDDKLISAIGEARP